MLSQLSQVLIELCHPLPVALGSHFGNAVRLSSLCLLIKSLLCCCPAVCSLCRGFQVDPFWCLLQCVDFFGSKPQQCIFAAQALVGILNLSLFLSAVLRPCTIAWYLNQVIHSLCLMSVMILYDLRECL